MKRGWSQGLLAIAALLLAQGAWMSARAQESPAASPVASPAASPDVVKRAKASPRVRAVAPVATPAVAQGPAVAEGSVVSTPTPVSEGGQADKRQKCSELRAERSGDDVVAIGDSKRIGAGDVVHGDAVVVGGNLDLDGTVTGDAVCVGGRAQLGPQAIVCGDLVTVGGLSEVDGAAYVGGEKVTVGGATIGPLGILKHINGWKHKPRGWGWEWGGRVAELVKEIVLLLFLAFVGFLMAVFLPRQTARIQEHLVGDFPRSTLMGVALMVILPLALVVLVFTCIGIPLVPLVLLLAAVSALLGYVVFARVLGQRLVGERHEMLQVLAGLLLLQAATLLGCLIAIPGGALHTVGSVFQGAGGVIKLAAATIGLGAAVYSRWGGRSLAESEAARTPGSRGGVATVDDSQL